MIVETPIVSTLRKDYMQEIHLRIFTILLSIAVLVRDLGLFNIPVIFFILLVILACVVLKYPRLVAFCYFFFPFLCSVHGFTMIPLIFALMIKAKRINYLQIFFSVLILLLEFINFLSYDFAVSMSRFVVYALYIALFFYLLYDSKLENKEICGSIKYYILGITAILIIITIVSISKFGIQGVFFDSIRIGGEDPEVQNEMTAGATRMNANTLAYFAISGLSLLIFVPGLFKRNIYKYLIGIFLILMGVLSTSRTWLLLFFLILVAYWFFNKSRAKASVAILMAAFMFFILLYTTDFMSAFVERFSERFDEENIETAGGRTELFEFYNNYFWSHPERIVQGTGVIYYKTVCNTSTSMHCGIQQIYVCYGILGVLIFLTCAFCFYRRYIKTMKCHMFYVIPFGVCFIFDQSIQFLNPTILMFPILASTLPLKLGHTVKSS